MTAACLRVLLRWAAIAALVSLIPGVGQLRAQIGEQPIRIIFPFAAGGSGDAVSRLIADRMRIALDRPVIVEKRAGADGRIGVRVVKEAAPDGITLLLTPIAPVAVYQHVYAKLDYDPIADLAPIFQVGAFDFGIAVGPQVEAKTLQDLVAWAKANPSQASLARTAGIDLRAVPYRGSAAGLADLVAGHVPIEITTTSDLVQMHKAGRIRVLATSDKARSPFLPDVPTFGEAGYNLVATGWYGMFAPAPPDIVARLNAVLPRNSPPYRRRRRNNGHPPSRRRDLRPRSKARTHDGTDGGEHPA